MIAAGEAVALIEAMTMETGGEVIVKDEGRLPTGSFKARGLALAVAMAKELGLEHLAMPTNGNAGAAMAVYERALRDGRVGAGERAVLFNCATGLKYPMLPVTRRLDRHATIDYAAL